MPKKGLAEAVSEAMPPDNGMRVGIVASVNPVVITIQGVPITDIGGQLTASMSPGDKVAMVREAGSWLILGAVVPLEGQGDSGVTELTLNNITDATASGTFVTVAGFAMQFRRTRVNSRLAMQLTVSARPTVAGATVGSYALSLVNDETGGSWSPTIITTAVYSTASAHISHTCKRVGTPASELGTGLINATLLWRRVSGAGTLNFAAGFDTLNLIIEEV